MKSMPLLFCFCAPIASGKSTVCARLETEVPNLQRWITTTTRVPRPGERDGVHYNFVSRENFEKRILAGDFVEYAEVSGNLYGTGKENISSAEAAGNDLLLDIDVQGAREFRKLYPESVRVIFLLPPSLAVLKERIKARGGDSEEHVQKRLEVTKKELKTLSAKGFADYTVVNDVLDSSVDIARAIILAERARRLDPEFVVRKFFESGS